VPSIDGLMRDTDPGAELQVSSTRKCGVPLPPRAFQLTQP
jgi:hypothetical protein